MANGTNTQVPFQSIGSLRYKVPLVHSVMVEIKCCRSPRDTVEEMLQVPEGRSGRNAAGPRVVALGSGVQMDVVLRPYRGTLRAE